MGVFGETGLGERDLYGERERESEGEVGEGDLEELHVSSILRPGNTRPFILMLEEGFIMERLRLASQRVVLGLRWG